MSENIAQILDGVAETLLITLYVRAMESQRPDSLIKDDKAVTLVSQIGYDFSRFKQIRMDEDDKITIVLRNREFDRYVQDFLSRHPDAVVVHIGCGLDSRFERVDNGQLEWFDLDLPEVIELRQKLLGHEGGRYHFLKYSAFDPTWLEIISSYRQRPVLFLAEGVFMYFEETQVKSLVLSLQERFPDAELVFDTFSPYLVKASNLRFAITKLNARYHWGLKHGKDLEGWRNGIRLLDEWFVFDHPEPRLAHVWWMRHIHFLARVIGIFHYQLGNAITR